MRDDLEALDELRRTGYIHSEPCGRWTGKTKSAMDKDTCSVCGESFYQIAETGCYWRFCPNCGARMVEE